MPWLPDSFCFVGSPQTPRDCSRVPARVSAEYLERCGPKDSDVPFNGGAASGPGATVEFKKRPFGILRYQPGEGMKGAMAMEIIPKSRYPGDPQGQAFASGVQSGWVVQSINGMNVQNEDFGKIMDMLDDEVADPRFSKSTALALEKQGGRMAEPVEAPLSVVFSSIPGYVYKGAQLTEDGQVPIPGFQFRKIPLELLTFGFGGLAESDATKSAITGFPFTTDNTVSLQLGFPRIGGGFRLGLEDPALSAEGADSTQQLLSMGYQQRLPGGGQLASWLKTTGEWGAAFRHEVEDIGIVTGGLNSQLDWNLDLNTLGMRACALHQRSPNMLLPLLKVKGFTPSVSYGATQDGMRVNARVDKDISKRWHTSYTVQNIPGKYSPVDFVHDGVVRFASGPHSLQATASYDRQLLKKPLQGSMSYTFQKRRMALRALLDSQRYQLALQAGPAQAGAAVPRKKQDQLGSQGYRLPALAILQEAREFVQPLALYMCKDNSDRKFTFMVFMVVVGVFEMQQSYSRWDSRDTSYVAVLPGKCELGEAGGSATDCFRAASAASLATTAAALGASASLGSVCPRLNGGSSADSNATVLSTKLLLEMNCSGSMFRKTAGRGAEIQTAEAQVVSQQNRTCSGQLVIGGGANSEQLQTPLLEPPQHLLRLSKSSTAGSTTCPLSSAGTLTGAVCIGTLFQGKKMGSVWMATDRHTGQKMAVKEVLLDTTEEGEKRAPLCVDREVSLYRTDLPIRVWGVQWPRNQLLSQIGAFDEPDIATYSRQVLEALHYLHTRKPSILHRDVKTANILLGVDGIVKLADFGCSKRASGNAVHTLRGSVQWMAPEVVNQQPYGRKADIWSFGCVLIEMLTTRPPWGHFETNVAAIIHVATSKELLPKMESKGKPGAPGTDFLLHAAHSKGAPIREAADAVSVLRELGCCPNANHLIGQTRVVSTLRRRCGET
ncbi:mkkA, partial [Symbiodinium sp. CCMP2456]